MSPEWVVVSLLFAVVTMLSQGVIPTVLGDEGGGSQISTVGLTTKNEATTTARPTTLPGGLPSPEPVQSFDAAAIVFGVLFGVFIVLVLAMLLMKSRAYDKLSLMSTLFRKDVRRSSQQPIGQNQSTEDAVEELPDETLRSRVNSIVKDNKKSGRKAEWGMESLRTSFSSVDSQGSLPINMSINTNFSSVGIGVGGFTNVNEFGEDAYSMYSSRSSIAVAQDPSQTMSSTTESEYSLYSTSGIAGYLMSRTEDCLPEYQPSPPDMPREKRPKPKPAPRIRTSSSFVVGSTRSRNRDDDKSNSNSMTSSTETSNGCGLGDDNSRSSNGSNKTELNKPRRVHTSQSMRHSQQRGTSTRQRPVAAPRIRPVKGNMSLHQSLSVIGQAETVAGEQAPNQLVKVREADAGADVASTTPEDIYDIASLGEPDDLHIMPPLRGASLQASTTSLVSVRSSSSFKPVGNVKRRRSADCISCDVDLGIPGNRLTRIGGLARASVTSTIRPQGSVWRPPPPSDPVPSTLGLEHHRRHSGMGKRSLSTTAILHGSSVWHPPPPAEQVPSTSLASLR